MFPSSVIIAGGKRRCDVNAMDMVDPSPHHVQLWPHVRASVVFSKGASGLRALRLIARSAGGSTFCTEPGMVEFLLFLIFPATLVVGFVVHSWVGKKSHGN